MTYTSYHHFTWTQIIIPIAFVALVLYLWNRFHKK
jgi:hypothetical protein